MSTDSKTRGTFSAFRHRDFAILWPGAFVSNIGTWMQALVIPFVLFEITGSAVWVGLAALAQFVPYFAFSPLGGWLADHASRRDVLRFTQVALAVAATALWAAWVLGVREPMALIAFLVISGALNGINLPNWQAFTSDLVPREDLHSAITLNSAQFNAARAIGPGIAGLALATLGASWTFALNSLSFAFVIVALFAVRNTGGSRRHAGTDGVAREFHQAIRYTIHHPTLAMIILITLLVALLGNPIFALTVVFAGEVYDVGPLALGLLNMAMGVGAIVAVPIVSGWPVSMPLSRSVLWGVGLMGSAALVLGLTTTYGIGMVALGAIGAAFLAVISGVNTSLQLHVDPRYRGRAMALRMMVFTLGTGIGSFLQGALADAIGPRAMMVGVGMTLLIATALLRWPRRRVRIESIDAPTLYPAS